MLHKESEGKNTSSKGTVGDSSWYETVASRKSEMKHQTKILSSSL